MRDYRRRYVRFQLHSNDLVDEKDLSYAFRKSLLSIYGEVIVADSRFYINEFDTNSGIGILHCTSDTVEQVLAAAVLIESINGEMISFQPLRTSGTIKGAKK